MLKLKFLFLSGVISLVWGTDFRNSLDSEDDGMEGEESPVYEQGSTVRVFAQVRSFQVTYLLLKPYVL